MVKPFFQGRGVPETHRSKSLRGFTMIELMIIIAILAVLVSIGLIKFRAAIQTSKLVVAKQTLKTIAFEVDLFEVSNGYYPSTLEEVGRENRRDPWGNPYIYLNFQTGTGSAVKYASNNGLVDPEAFNQQIQNAKGKGGSKKSAKGKAKGKGGGAAVAEPTYVAANIDDHRRTDQFLFPLNTDYDLFCLGPNGKAFTSLTESFSLDDVIRANDGAYFGPVSEY